MFTPEIAAKCRKISIFTLGLVFSTTLSWAQTDSPGLGNPVDSAQLQQFDLIAGPDGDGLPDGSGSALQGKDIFEARCQACHGLSGEGTSSATVLVGGNMQSDTPPLKTVGSYWPHATTLFDYIRRAMPADAPKSLTNNEVYQVVAYVLYLNGIVNQYDVLNKDTLLTIQMPNKDGFIDHSQTR